MHRATCWSVEIGERSQRYRYERQWDHKQGDEEQAEELAQLDEHHL